MKETVQKKIKQSKIIIWILSAIIVGLLAVNIYLFKDKNSNHEEQEKVEIALESVTNEKDEILKEFEASLSRLDLLLSENKNLEGQLAEQYQNIEEQKNRIQELLNIKNANDRELKEARKLVNSLNNSINNYQKQITKLTLENQQLADEKAELQYTLEDINQAHQQLNAKVESAKILNIDNIRINPIILRKGGNVEKEVKRIRRADILRISFDIHENKLIEENTETIYVAIYNPEQHLLSNAALGSGSFKQEKTGINIHYSLKENLNILKGESIKDYPIDWVQNADYIKGEYTIEIYHKQQLIARNRVPLR